MKRQADPEAVNGHPQAKRRALGDSEARECFGGQVFDAETLAEQSKSYAASQPYVETLRAGR